MDPPNLIATAINPRLAGACHEVADVGLHPVSGGGVAGEHRDAGEILQAASRRHGGLRPVDRPVPGPRSARRATGPAREGTGATRDGSPPPIRGSDETNR